MRMKQIKSLAHYLAVIRTPVVIARLLSLYDLFF